MLVKTYPHLDSVIGAEEMYRVYPFEFPFIAVVQESQRYSVLSFWQLKEGAGE